MIIRMMWGFPSSSGKVTDRNIEAYLAAVEDCSADAVSRACADYAAGRVEGQDLAFMPSAASLAARARTWDSAIAKLTADRAIAEASRPVSYRLGAAPPDGMVPLGPTKIDFGQGSIDMTIYTAAQQAWVIEHKRAPTLDEVQDDPEFWEQSPLLRRLKAIDRGDDE